MSGGPGSRAPWDTLGEYGKDFVSDATTPRELRRFAGPQSDVTDPIRVYAGLRSAETPDARAALVVRELDEPARADRDS